jgi:hypothetical protein
LSWRDRCHGGNSVLESSVLEIGDLEISALAISALEISVVEYSGMGGISVMGKLV